MLTRISVSTRTSPAQPTMKRSLRLKGLFRRGLISTDVASGKALNAAASTQIHAPVLAVIRLICDIVEVGGGVYQVISCL